MGLRRKLLSPRGKCVFWLCGDDAPKTNASGTTWWPLRIGPTMYFRFQGNAYYDDSDHTYVVGQTNNDYLISSEKSKFDMGHHFRFEYDLYVNRSLSGNNSLVWFDVGALGNAAKAINFGLGTNATGTNGTNYEGYTMSWKLQGNYSSPFPLPWTHPALPLPKDGEYHHVVGCNEIIDGGDGYDRYVATINGLSKKYDTQVPKVNYGPPWSGGSFYIGRGWNTGYFCACKIRNIKIYTMD